MRERTANFRLKKWGYCLFAGGYYQYCNNYTIY